MLKAIARRLVRKEHRQFLNWYRGHFGIPSAIAAYIDLLRSDGVAHAPSGLAGGPVFLRPGTSDEDVFDEIFIKKEYDLDCADPLFIVDAGAHIGLASAYFASKYPKAIVVAIEPESSNFEMLLMNTRAYPNVRPIQAGLWNKKTHLRIQDPDVETWSFKVAESASEEGIAAIGIRDILADFKTDRIDVLKVDIEGSEVEVLGGDSSWMDNVAMLIVELHDRFRPGCSQALENALAGRNYHKSISGESIVITGIGRVGV